MGGFSANRVPRHRRDAPSGGDFKSTNLGEGRPNFGQVVVLPDRRVGLNLPTRFDCGRILTVDKDWVRTRAGSVEGTQHKSAFNVELARTLELVEEKHFLGEET